MRVESEILQAAKILKRWWWLLGASLLVAVVIGYAVTKKIKPIYEASASLMVNAGTVGGSSDPYSSELYSVMLAQTYANVIESYRVADAVQRQTHADIAAETVLGEIKATAVTNMPLISIVVRDRSPERAALLAEGVATTFINLNRADESARYSRVQSVLNTQLTATNQRIASTDARLRALSANASSRRDNAVAITNLSGLLANLQTAEASLNSQLDSLMIDQSQSTTLLTMVEHAQVPTVPVSPNTKFNLLLAVLAGLLLAIVIIAVMEHLDDSIRSSTAVEDQLKSPVLGTIPRMPNINGLMLTLGARETRIAEAFKGLRTNIYFANASRSPRSLLITSPSRGEGKTTVAANCAVSLAQAGQRVILIDADLRCPRLHRVFDLPPGPGLTDYLRDPAIGLDIVRETSIDNVRVVMAGSIPPNPSELLLSEHMAHLMDALAAEADVVVIDSPAVLPVTDALILACRVDDVLLLMNTKTTTIHAAAKALQALQMVGAHIGGLIINEYDVQAPAYGSRHVGSDSLASVGR